MRAYSQAAETTSKVILQKKKNCNVLSNIK